MFILISKDNKMSDFHAFSLECKLKEESGNVYFVSAVCTEKSHLMFPRIGNWVLLCTNQASLHFSVSCSRLPEGPLLPIHVLASLRCILMPRGKLASGRAKGSRSALAVGCMGKKELVWVPQLTGCTALGQIDIETCCQLIPEKMFWFSWVKSLPAYTRSH